MAFLDDTGAWLDTQCTAHNGETADLMASNLVHCCDTAQHDKTALNGVSSDAEPRWRNYRHISVYDAFALLLHASCSARRSESGHQRAPQPLNFDSREARCEKKI